MIAEKIRCVRCNNKIWDGSLCVYHAGEGFKHWDCPMIPDFTPRLPDPAKSDIQDKQDGEYKMVGGFYMATFDKELKEFFKKVEDKLASK